MPSASIHSASRTAGDLAIVLHAHLPYVRHPEHEEHLEERWFFGALLECYLPLLEVFESKDLFDPDLVSVSHRPGRGVFPYAPTRAITLSVSPTLAAMARDPLLRSRFDRHLERLLKFAEAEARRARGTDLFDAMQFHVARFEQIQARWSAIDRDLLGAFAGCARRGVLELATTAATHAFLPMFESAPQVWNAQIATAVRAHTDTFGAPPRTFWLPECGYARGVDRVLVDHGIRVTVVETHGVLLARPRPPLGPFAPVVTPEGLIVVARDPASSRQVWSHTEGYPGHSDYREYHRDLGYERPIAVLGELAPSGDRVQLGIKPYRITGKDPQKLPYDPGRAEGRARADAIDFVAKKEAQVRALSGAVSSPLLVAPFDAELFGHWWFEGPVFLREVLAAARRSDVLRVRALSDAVCDRDAAVCEIGPSSWGEGGYGNPWLGSAASELFLPLLRQAEDVTRLVKEFGEASNPLVQRALSQACTEVLLAQASDFPFMLHFQKHVSYARDRVDKHRSAYAKIAAALRDGTLETQRLWLDDLERRDNLAARIDPRVFLGR